MDFSFTEDQEALRQLARKILDDHCTHERLKAVEATPEWFHRTVWTELAKANLLGVALPEDVGGSGLGFFELVHPARGDRARGGAGAGLADAGARRPADRPVRLRGAAPALAAGRERRRRRSSPPRWSRTAATSRAPSPRRPGATAAHWRLDGVKTCVPAAHLAAAHPGAGAHRRRRRSACSWSIRNGSGVQLERADHDQRRAAVRADAVAARRSAPTTCSAIRSGGAAIVDWMLQRAIAGLCVIGAGVAERALRMTAEYTTSRKQFGKPLATFQAVAQRAADAFI